MARLFPPIQTSFTGCSHSALNFNDLAPDSPFQRADSGRKCRTKTRSMARANTASSSQILLFPHNPNEGDGRPVEGPKIEGPRVPSPGASVVLCGTYRNDADGLRRTCDHLRDSGFSVLSPS